MNTPLLSQSKLAVVLTRPTGYFLIDGQTLKTISYSSNPGKVFRYANERGFVLVNETSQRGMDIRKRLNSADRFRQWDPGFQGQGRQ